MGILFGFLVLIATIILQTVIVSRLPLLQGTADLVMLVLIAWGLQDEVQSAWEWTVIGGLMVSFVSAMPVPVYLIVYLVITGITRSLQFRIWQMPILAMLMITIFGTIFQHTLSILVLQFFQETPLDWLESLNIVTLPSLVLNLFLAFPVYVVLKDFANWVYPAETEL